MGFACEEHILLTKQSFVQAINASRISFSPKQIVTSQKRLEEAGLDCVEQWIATDSLPTAILAAYDEMAIGVIRALHNHGLRVPQDVSVCGRNEIDSAPYLIPSLSSIRIPVDEICHHAVEILMKKIEHPYYFLKEKMIFPSELILRESVGPAPQ